MRIRNAKRIGGAFLMGIGFTVLLLGPALAQERTGSIGPRAAYYESNDGDGAWYGGAQFRLFPTDRLGVEGSIDYRQEDFGPVTAQTYPVQASLLPYIISNDRLALYGIGGVGWYFTRLDHESSAIDDKTDDRFGLHAGGGLEFFLNERWSLDGSYRYIWLEEFKSKQADLTDKEFDDSGHMFTVGLNYLF